MNKVWDTVTLKLTDPNVSEFRVNDSRNIFYIENGQRKRLPLSFNSEEEYESSLIDIASMVKGYKDFSGAKYIFEGPLEYSRNGVDVKARFHAMLPPATQNPIITIAKKSTLLTNLDDIARNGTMNLEMLDFLKQAVKARFGIVLSGATGAGKTTFLEALTKLIDDKYRIGVAEDSPELVLPQSDVCYTHSVPYSPGMNKNDVATLSWVVSQFKRMRTQSLIIGEVRGEEFADFLVAANSGIEGCITTLHANTPRLALEAMKGFAVSGAPNIPIEVLSRSISQAVDLIIQLIITPDGRHRVASIEEIEISNDDAGKITSSTLYQWNPATDTHSKVGTLSENSRNRFDLYGVDHARFDGINNYVEQRNSGSVIDTSFLDRRI